MKQIAPDTFYIDLEHLDRRCVIGASLIEDGDRCALVDPGPGSTVGTLLEKLGRRGLSAGNIDAVLLTHIHLDHAGATGALVARNPSIRVYVHERGAPHVIDPGKLLHSAGRLYGDDMDRLWGEFSAVPAGNVTTVTTGDDVRVGSRIFRVTYTPGHASHHVCYLEPATGTAFVGDTGGVSVAGGSGEGEVFVLPPTPPPDIHLERWRASIETIRSWSPARLVLTHFGSVTCAGAHLDALTSRLADWADRVRHLLESGMDDDQAMASFGDDVERDIRASTDSETAEALIQAVAPHTCWQGLARYWRKYGGLATG